MCTASFLGFLLPAAIVAITVGIYYFGIIRVLPMRGSFLLPVCLISIYQPLWLFSQLYLFLPLWHACRFHKVFTLALSSGESLCLVQHVCAIRQFLKTKKTYLVTMGWLLCKTLKFTFFFNNSLVRQNSHPDYFESLDLVLALYSEQFTLPSNLAYKWQGHC